MVVRDRPDAPEERGKLRYQGLLTPLQAAVARDYSKREWVERRCRRLLEDLGIGSFADLQERHDAVQRRLPEVWAVAEEIMAANPAIE